MKCVRNVHVDIGWVDFVYSVLTVSTNLYMALYIPVQVSSILVYYEVCSVNK